MCAFAIDAELEAVGHGDVESFCEFLILIYTKDTAEVIHVKKRVAFASAATTSGGYLRRMGSEGGCA